MCTRAIVRRPGINFSQGISSSGLGPPDYEKALEQHAAYCACLEGLGIELIPLEPDPNFPDCTFVEDTAVVTDKVAVIARPGDPRRRGEEAEIAGILARFRPLAQIESPGTLDGGDVLAADGRFFIGTGERTNGKGALAMTRVMAREEAFAGFERIVIPDEESYAATCLFIRGRLVIAAGFPRATELLSSLGHEMIELDMSEFMKMDGGLTCLSIRF